MALCEITVLVETAFVALQVRNFLHNNFIGNFISPIDITLRRVYFLRKDSLAFAHSIFPFSFGLERIEARV
jgi:hypothetical protein